MTRKRIGKALLPAAVFLLAACCLFLLFQRLSPSGNAGEKHITISVTYADGTGEDYSVDTRAAYLKEAAESVLTLGGKNTSQGFALLSVNGVTADFETEPVYWAIYVNGEYGSYSLDRQPVEDGGAYALVYETY